ncbi:MAG: MBL fold metallo-hydrolase [Hyphomicrobiales bacterium]
MTITLKILGCGSSGGVPRVGNNWGHCDPENPKNRRRRCSVLVERENSAGKTSVLIDTPPDLREQLIDAGVHHLDGVLFTHDHADHTHGIDDLRPLAIMHRKRVNVWADYLTAQVLLTRFGYCFQTPPGSNYPSILELHSLNASEKVAISGEGGEIKALPIELEHGEIPVLGFRIGNTAYTPDLNGVPEDSLKHLSGLDCWIIDALRRAPHPSHLSLEESLEWISILKPKRAILTNMHVDLDYETLCSELPAGVEPAYDGMCICL